MVDLINWQKRSPSLPQVQVEHDIKNVHFLLLWIIIKNYTITQYPGLCCMV